MSRSCGPDSYGQTPSHPRSNTGPVARPCCVSQVQTVPYRSPLSTAYHARFVPHQITLVMGPSRARSLVSGPYRPAGGSHVESCTLPTNGLQRRRHPIQSDHTNGIASFDRRLGHTVDHTGLFALRDGHAPFFLDCTQAFGPVVTHASHEHANRLGLELIGHTAQQHIRTRTMPVNPRLI